MRGYTGGLVIPTAEVLPEFGMALGYSGFTEPKFGEQTDSRTISIGFGILKHVELFGRYADYSSTPKGQFLNSGDRDVSANIKVRLPFLPERGPQVAFGLNDPAGGNVLFASRYGVVTQRWQRFSATLGYVHILGNRHEEDFDGVFGGLAWRIDPTGVTLLAEHDGRTAYLGGRWYSPPLAFAGDLRLGAGLQQSFGATYPDGRDADAFSFAVDLRWPAGNLDARRSDHVPPQNVRRDDPGTAGLVDAKPGTLEGLGDLRRALVAKGLERVRVGLRGDSTSLETVIEYENHRFAWNEVDALGLVLGVGSDMSPSEVRFVRAVTLKDGLRIHETVVEASVFRGFLQGGPVEPVRESLNWNPGSSNMEGTRWEQDASSGTTRMRFEVRPGLNYTMGTELGAFDYSLAAKPQLVVPLWTGARMTAGYSIPMDHSLNVEDGRAFSRIRHREGLETVSLGQSYGIGRRAFLHVAVGRFHFDSWGTQSELVAFVPGSADVVRLRGAFYHPEPGGLEGDDRAGAVSYRRFWGPATWTEIGWQRYGDGTAGPTLEWTRWTSDLGMTLFVRQGGDTRFAGFKAFVPLTPRRGMAPRFATLKGPGHYSQGIRSVVGAKTNSVMPSSTRELIMYTGLDNEFFGNGRMNEDYLRSQLYRMREAFSRYAVNLDREVPGLDGHDN